MKPYFIGVAGATCSGKSTLCKKVASMCPEVTHIKMDDFFRDKDSLPVQGNYFNREVLESLEIDYLTKVLDRLKKGKEARMPIYSKKEERRTGYREVHAGEIVLAEGFLLFSAPRIRDMLDLRVFIDIDGETLRKRRLKRQPDIGSYLDEVVIPAYNQYKEEAMRKAHRIIDGGLSQEQVLGEFLNLMNLRIPV